MMCSRLLKRQSEQNRSRLYLASERLFNRVVAFYGRTLQWVLKWQTATLLVAASTLVLTIFLYVIVPKGLFPVQDTGTIQAISQAPQTISFTAMSEKQQALADVVLKDPAVESLSSFIGIDGTNTTLNSGRMLINLKPLNERKVSASDVIRRLQPQLDKVEGIILYMQPVQDLTVEDRVSRTQFQYTLEDANADELNTWTKKLVESSRTLPQLSDVATDQQTLGSQAKLVIDRVTASRLGITPLAIDNVLYDAFGQRQVTTLFTQLNQYHLVLEALPDFQTDPAKLNEIYVKSSSGGAVPLSAFTHFESGTAPLAINRQGQFPSVTISFNLAPGAALGQATTAIERAQKETWNAAERAGVLSRDGRVISSITKERTVVDPRSGRHRLHRSRRALRELHPSDHHIVDVTVGRCWGDSSASGLSAAIWRSRLDRNHSSRSGS